MSWFCVVKSIIQRKKKLSDIEFLSIKEFNGDLKTDEDTRSSVGTGAFVTAGTGKDLYLAKAKCTITTRSDNFSGDAVVQLQANGVLKATHSEAVAASQASVPSDAGTGIYEFVISGIKVTTGQTIRLEVTTVSNAKVEINTEIICFETVTGESPAV